MDNKNRKLRVNKQSNSNRNNHNGNDNDSDNDNYSDEHKAGDLHFDIIVDIISRLPIKLIIACKLLSKTLNNLISGPSFSTIYLTNKSNSYCTIYLDVSKPHWYLSLLEYNQKDFYNEKGSQKIRKYRIFNTERLPGGSSSSCKLFTICGYCNGLICLLKFKLGLYKVFVINPILGEFVQLPEHVHCDNGNRISFSYSLGYCQLSNRYKVLRVVTENLGGSTCKTNSEIFTIGYDQIWRSVPDVNVPHSKKWTCAIPHIRQQQPMIPLHSALHWIVHEYCTNISLKPNWKDSLSICAFDMTEEKANALQLPPEVAGFPTCVEGLNVLLDKLCLWGTWRFPLADLWVMDEYGVEGSWTKKLVLEMARLPYYTSCSTLMPLVVSPEGVVLISGNHKFIFYDMTKESSVTAIRRPDHDSFAYPIPLVPDFVSLRNIVQPSGDTKTRGLDVQPGCLVSETAFAPLDHQLQQTNGPRH